MHITHLGIWVGTTFPDIT